MVIPTALPAPRPAHPPADEVPGDYRSFLFGQFLLQPERQLLLKDGLPVRIGGRAIELLAALVEQPGALMSKRDLLQRAWPDVFVAESNLKVNIANLRRVLGEQTATPRFIATVAGRGYRFIAAVRSIAATPPAPMPPRGAPPALLFRARWEMPAPQPSYSVTYAPLAGLVQRSI